MRRRPNETNRFRFIFIKLDYGSGRKTPTADEYGQNQYRKPQIAQAHNNDISSFSTNNAPQDGIICFRSLSPILSLSSILSIAYARNQNRNRNRSHAQT